MHPLRGALSGDEIRRRLIKGSGEPYVRFLQLTATGEPKEIDIVRLPSGQLSDITSVPAMADLLLLSGDKRSYYLGGMLYWPDEVVSINDPTKPDLAQVFADSGGFALLRIRSGMHYVCLNEAYVHIPLTENGTLDLEGQTSG